MSKSKKSAKMGGKQRTFTGDSLAMVAFPLGGIGTGSISLSGRGGLVDWAVFNRPNMGWAPPRTFPLIWARAEGEEPVCRVLEAPPLPPFQGGGGGDPHENGEGFPHMDSAEFRGEYPFARVDFKSKALPVRVRLEAFNPFVPSDPDDSGFPAAVLHYEVKNTRKTPVHVTLAWSMMNVIGSLGRAEMEARIKGHPEFGLGGNVNEIVREKGLRGLAFTSKKWNKPHPRYGSMALLTPNSKTTILKYWLRGGWFDAKHDLWDTFSSAGRFKDRDYGPSEDGQSDAGAVGVREQLEPGGKKTITFYVTWYFPTFEKYWGEEPCCDSPSCKGNGKPATWKNYYAKQFKSAVDVGVQLNKRHDGLYETTARFHDALFASTLPACVLDAVSSQMATLKTATAVRLTDGTFYGFEGTTPTHGCCEGSCTHVWNYQQALAFLFPGLERSMRSADYKHNMREKGSMCFRLQLPIGSKPNDFHPAADGQMGGIIKTCRDWKISGDSDWLKSIWPRVKQALEFAWEDWDANQDGVMEGIQHNTYDIEFLGPNPMMAGFYLGALLAGAQMANAMGEPESAEKYLAVYEKGRAWTEKNLFNGDYYEQKYDPKKAPRHQFGKGCLSDQLLGQWLAAVAGLGYVLDRKQVRKTLASIFNYNWRESMAGHANPQRVYALNDEAGLLLCSWPMGNRPAIPFPYSDEVWTGIEYHVASHLIMEGMVEEGVTVVEAARARHDGVKRNPWNEFECGNHYARAMSSYGLLQAFSGFQYDRTKGLIGFEPKSQDKKFRCFWALDGCWGVYTRKRKKATLECHYGTIEIEVLSLPGFAGPGAKVTVNKEKRAASIGKDGAVRFKEPVQLEAGASMEVRR